MLTVSDLKVTLYFTFISLLQSCYTEMQITALSHTRRHSWNAEALMFDLTSFYIFTGSLLLHSSWRDQATQKLFRTTTKTYSNPCRLLFHIKAAPYVLRPPPQTAWWPFCSDTECSPLHLSVQSHLLKHLRPGHTSRSTANSVTAFSFSFKATRSSRLLMNWQVVSARSLYIYAETTIKNQDVGFWLVWQKKKE